MREIIVDVCAALKPAASASLAVARASIMRAEAGRPALLEAAAVRQRHCKIAVARAKRATSRDRRCRAICRPDVETIRWADERDEPASCGADRCGFAAHLRCRRRADAIEARTVRSRGRPRLTAGGRRPSSRFAARRADVRAEMDPDDRVARKRGLRSGTNGVQGGRARVRSTRRTSRCAGSGCATHGGPRASRPVRRHAPTHSCTIRCAAS